MDVIEVTCAIIFVENKILVVQRSKIMSMPYKWEFPGGKIEDGETEKQCIKREILEELNINIKILKRLTPNTHFYPKKAIKLIPFIAEYVSGKMILKEHLAFKLLSKENLLTLDWAEADIPILKEFLSL